MAGQVFIWTGGQLADAERHRRLAEALPVLPPPAPLQPSAYIEYRWGADRFDILATACSVRTTAWGSGEMTWLHCKAMNVADITPDEPIDLTTVLIPAHYVTGIRPGPTFRLSRSRSGRELAVFPPNQSGPLERLPLAEVEGILARLLGSERN